MLPEVDANFLPELPVWYVATLLSMTVHEAAHAIVGVKSGDETARDQVTLDPSPHIRQEPVGTMLVPIVSYVLFKGSWMIGYASAPYDPVWAGRFPKRAAIMAAAGPISNFLLAAVAGGLIAYGLSTGHFVPSGARLAELIVSPDGPTLLTTSLSVLFSINILLGTFNLIPLPPLDGHAIVPLVLSKRATRKYFEFFRAPGSVIFGLAISFALFSRVAGPVLYGAFAILVDIVS